MPVFAYQRSDVVEHQLCVGVEILIEAGRAVVVPAAVVAEVLVNLLDSCFQLIPLVEVFFQMRFAVLYF